MSDSSSKQAASNAAVEFCVNPVRSLSGSLRVPGDKSISHRSIMMGAIADGTVKISGFLEGEDALSTLKAFRDLGVTIEGPRDGDVVVHGVGVDGLRAPSSDLDCGNAGTAMRLMMGLLAGQSFPSTLIGDASLSLRPMRRVSDPLCQMGASIQTNNGCPPIHITPVPFLQGISYEMPVASAQLKSALLLAGLYAKGVTCVVESVPTRDHTERLMSGFGVPIRREGNRIMLSGPSRLQAMSKPIDIPSDISSAAFFLVAASIAPQADITLRHVGVNPTRIGVISILKKMGAKIDILNLKDVSGEPVADLRVQSSALQGIDIPLEWVPLAIDEFPAIFIAAACASGRTVLRGAQELRVKESDRISVMAEGMHALGVPVEAMPDGMIIEGKEPKDSVFEGGVVDSHGDHRVAMAFAIASVRASGPITVRNTANVATSFPGFHHHASSIGFEFEVL